MKRIESVKGKRGLKNRTDRTGEYDDIYSTYWAASIVHEISNQAEAGFKMEVQSRPQG